MRSFTAVAFCAAGAEKVVSNELKKISSINSNSENDDKGAVKKQQAYTILESGFGRVRFQTNLHGLYRALMSLRTADRLLLEAGNFSAPDFDALFEGTKNIPWEDYIGRGMGLKVSKVRSSNSRLKAETSIQAVVHKAAAERLCQRYGIHRLPEGTASLPEGMAGLHGRTAGSGEQGGVKQAELRVFLEKDNASVLLDLSGAPLFKRGYRPAGGIAPLRESTAAAIILLSGWRRKFPLYDPFCGSGTIIIEAALYAWDHAPGLGRHFAISDLAIADRRAEETIRGELAEKIDYSRPICIEGSDEDEKAIALTRANLKRALQKDVSLSNNIKLSCLPMKEAKGESKTTPGFIITNPPYGIRIGDVKEAEGRYAEMSLLCKIFPGWKLALICNHKGFESHFGRKADSCRGLKSGPVDTWLYQYEKL
jgi:putative N6-adenine-specific DNA methylase